MKEITKIYLVTNCYNIPNKVYIGKTKNNRKNDHKQTYGKDIVYTEIDQIFSFKRTDWEPLETYWIQQFKAWGFEVLNKKIKGGSGVEFCSEEHKLKIGIANSKPKPKWFGNKISKITTGLNKGRKITWSSKISNSLKGKPKSKKHIENIGKVKLGNTNLLNYKYTIKQRENQSISKSKFPIICLELNHIFRNINLASKEMNISPTLIRDVCEGKRVKAKKIHF
jgi:hypothetical protein